MRRPLRGGAVLLQGDSRGYRRSLTVIGKRPADSKHNCNHSDRYGSPVARDCSHPVKMGQQGLLDSYVVSYTYLGQLF